MRNSTYHYFLAFFILQPILEEHHKWLILFKGWARGDGESGDAMG